MGIRRVTFSGCGRAPFFARRFVTGLAVFCFICAPSLDALRAGNIVDPSIDEARSPSRREQAVLAGGCFWGLEAIFERVKGVQSVVSGYSGGEKKTAHSDLVESGRTGHAESVMVTYDPSKITYGQILKIFFFVAHDPTQLNRQGPDTGAQYRSAIFYANEEQKRIAETYIRQLTEANVFPGRIVTDLTPLAGFYPAEKPLQHYSQKHPKDPYVIQNDLPKLKSLSNDFPELITSKE